MIPFVENGNGILRRSFEKRQADKLMAG